LRLLLNSIVVADRHELGYRGKMRIYRENRVDGMCGAHRIGPPVGRKGR
jgi:hypothetical protein